MQNFAIKIAGFFRFLEAIEKQTSFTLPVNFYLDLEKDQESL